MDKISESTKRQNSEIQREILNIAYLVFNLLSAS